MSATSTLQIWASYSKVKLKPHHHRKSELSATAAEANLNRCVAASTGHCDERDGVRFRTPSERALLEKCHTAWDRRHTAPLWKLLTVPLMAARTRAIDAWVEKHSRGSDYVNLVLLGSGFDARAHRLALPSGLRVYEVDHAAMIRRKREIMGDREGLAYVTVDFNEDDVLERLKKSGFDGGPTLLVWEGVTLYLGDDSLRRTIRSFAGIKTRWICNFYDKACSVFRWYAKHVGEAVDGIRTPDQTKSLLSSECLKIVDMRYLADIAQEEMPDLPKLPPSTVYMCDCMSLDVEE